MKLTDFRDYTEICTNPEFYWLAYKNIYANDGSMTAGADGTTIDGMGNERIERIILSLKTEVTNLSLQEENILQRKTAVKNVLWVFSRGMINSCRKSLR